MINENLDPCKPGYIISPEGEIIIVPEDKHHNEAINEIITKLTGCYVEYGIYKALMTIVQNFNYSVYFGFRLEDDEECKGIGKVFCNNIVNITEQQFDIIKKLHSNSKCQEINFELRVGNMKTVYETFEENYIYYKKGKNITK